MCTLARIYETCCSSLVRLYTGTGHLIFQDRRRGRGRGRGRGRLPAARVLPPRARHTPEAGQDLLRGSRRLLRTSLHIQGKGAH